MMFFKSAFLLALCAWTNASPITSIDSSAIEARTANPIVLVSCGGKAFTPAKINAAIANSHNYYTASNGKQYPHYFGDGEGIFNNPDQLWLFPLADTPWTGGAPGKYRVIVDDSYNYQGTVYHAGGQGDNSFTQCL